MAEVRQFGAGDPSTAYYAPPPNKRVNFGALFMSTLLQVRNPWAMEVFRERLRQADPTARAEVLVRARQADNARAEQLRMAIGEQARNARADTGVIEAWLKSTAQVLSPDVAGRWRAVSSQISGEAQVTATWLDAQGRVQVQQMSNDMAERSLRSEEYRDFMVVEGDDRQLLGELRNQLVDKLTAPGMGGRLTRAELQTRLLDLAQEFSARTRNMDATEANRLMAVLQQDARSKLAGSLDPAVVEEVVQSLGNAYEPPAAQQLPERGGLGLPSLGQRYAPPNVGQALSPLNAIAAQGMGAPPVQTGGSQSASVSGRVPAGGMASGPGGLPTLDQLQAILAQQQQAPVDPGLAQMLGGPSAVQLAQEEMSRGPGLGGFFSPLPSGPGDRAGLLDRAFGNLSDDELAIQAYAEARQASGRDKYVVPPHLREAAKQRAEYAAARAGLPMAQRPSLDQLADELQLGR